VLAPRGRCGRRSLANRSAPTISRHCCAAQSDWPAGCFSPLGAAASDVGVVRGHGDAARRPIRAAAEPRAACDAGPGRGRRLRKLDLCGRRDFRDRGTGSQRRSCLPRSSPARRRVFAAGLAVAAVLGSASPRRSFSISSLRLRARRRPPIVIGHFECSATCFRRCCAACSTCRPIGSLLLPIEFPATFVAGAIALSSRAARAPSRAGKTATWRPCRAGGRGLCASWLLVSTLGDNNDLGLRAVLARRHGPDRGAAVGMMLASRRTAIIAVALGGLILSLPGTASMIRYNIGGSPVPDGRFSRNRRNLWAAVRRYASPTARVANNPLFLQDLTPWPANMSWALLGQSQFVLCRPRIGARLSRLCRRRAARRSMRNSSACSPGKARADDVSEMARRNMAATSSSSCRRTRPGPTTRSPQARIIAWRKAATGAGGFT
jgi:hypothetical protein